MAPTSPSGGRHPANYVGAVGCGCVSASLGVLREVRHYAHSYTHEVLIGPPHMRPELHAAVWPVATVIPGEMSLRLGATDSVGVAAMSLEHALPHSQPIAQAPVAFDAYAFRRPTAGCLRVGAFPPAERGQPLRKY